MNWLLSYPSSGNGWVRYSIELLSKLPTHGHRAFSMSERMNNFLEVDLLSNPIIVKRHEIKPIELDLNDRLILLIRDPFQCIKYDTNPIIEFNKYINLIKTYEDFKGKKLIIKYTDLFKIETILSILEFYGIKPDKFRLEDFKERFNEHLNISKSLHKKQLNKEGTDLRIFFDEKIISYAIKYV